MKRDFFDLHAMGWDERLQYEKKIPQILQIVKGFDLKDGHWVLDVGTGTGILIPFIKEEVGLSGRVVAMDFSIKMLEMAKKRKGAGEKYLINASVGSIPLQPNLFDRVTCFSAFPHFPDKPRALQEMVRILKRGGNLFIAHLHSIAEINRFHRETGGPVANDILLPVKAIMSLMEESGLTEISIIDQPGAFMGKGKKL
ncbi:MAG: class I SAM-dependent methyltransferase [Thermodesulfobacteriota bacterium]|nr:class I SAM-dependent methyltransferase [Thermodesulfobacteriota bacterium]